MPAIERSFSGPDLPPQKLYLDTDTMVSAVVSTDAHHSRSTALFDFLARHGLTTIFLCPVSWMEYAHVFGKEWFRQKLPPELGYLNAVRGWDRPEVRGEYYNFVRQTFDDLLSPFDWEEIPITFAIWERSLALMGRYNLDSQDAMHLACAESAGVRDLASFDRVFRRVDGLYLWNDRIYDAT